MNRNPIVIRTTRRTIKAWVFFVALMTWALVFVPPRVRAQDGEMIQRRLLASLTEIENYPSVKFTGRLIGKANLCEVSFEVRGEEIWQEYELFPIDEPRKPLEAKQQKVRRIVGSSLPRTAAFDGKTYWTYDPYNMLLTIRKGQKFRGGGSYNKSMLPAGWLALPADGSRPFQRFVDNKSADVSTEQFSDGRWRLSMSGLGSQLPLELRDRVGFRELHIVVDPKSNYLVTEYEGSGGQRGNVSGTLEWAEVDGFWYPKHVRHLWKGELDCEWFIDEISFDAKDCRKRFDNLESLVPFSTMLHEYDGNNKLTKARYQGGKDGEQEYKLRHLALSKYRRSE